MNPIIYGPSSMKAKESKLSFELAADVTIY
ncbi:MAG: hypothetical protein Hyperionvirus24_10 [Hyperionvirus sp.]|uniref:Uncharacterized protein n=1 Tax=Hyperionvirus sp. TaxID=2487770 RepID=A0A3G5AAX2_9VIRU|nr:MAG: hypothetical protein Hyperionvirus24_10 [Hyperionvirus sp.]